MKSFLGLVALATVTAGFAPQTAFADGGPLRGIVCSDLLDAAQHGCGEFLRGAARVLAT